MSALNFPDNPADVGNVYVGDNGITYDYVNGKWRGRTAPGTGGGSTGTSWNLTSQGNGCPIDVTLTTTTFDVRVPRNHLLFNEDGSWDIGSYTNGNYITGDTSANFNILTNFGQTTWTFGADGILKMPPGNETTSGWIQWSHASDDLTNVAGAGFVDYFNAYTGLGLTAPTDTNAEKGIWFGTPADPSSPFQPETSMVFRNDTLYLPKNGYIKSHDINLVGYANLTTVGTSVTIQTNDEYDWVFGADGKLTLPDNSRLNSGGIDVRNSAEIKTTVNRDGGDPSIINTSEIALQAGNGGISAQVFGPWTGGADGSGGPTLVYAGVENLAFSGNGPGFAGFVAIDPGVTSNYSVDVDNDSKIFVNFYDPITTTGYVAALGVLTSNIDTLTGKALLNGIAVTSTQTALTGSAGTSISTDGGTWTFGTDGSITLPALSGQIGRSGYTNGIDLYNDNGTGYVRMNYADESFMWADISGAHVQTTGGTWDFGTDGNLTLPAGGEIKSAAGTGNVTIEANDGTARTWTFGGDGTVTFPDDTVQTTAYKRVTGSWTVTSGSDDYSFTVPLNGTYAMWVRGTIDNGIIVWNATATVTNDNVPVIGQQFAWNYTGGGTPIEITAIPTQFVGTANTIVSSNPSVGTSSNVFNFTINNSSGSAKTVYWGYVLQ